MVGDLINNVFVPDGGGSGTGKIPVQKIYIKARRDILTEDGFIKAGQKGWVSKAWVERVAANRCGSCGSVNWFSYAYS